MRRHRPLKELLALLREPLSQQKVLIASVLIGGWGKFLIPMIIPWATGSIIDTILAPERMADASQKSAQSDELIQYAILNFSWTFQAGKSTALIGPSGSGKSTISQLLLRFYDPTKGKVTVDGVDLKDIRQEYFRSKVAVVLQDPILFSGTIAENIGFASPDATIDDIIASAHKAQAHEFIEVLPDGYDTRVGERGLLLSGGQRQRIAIARALLRNPKVLILDEATSALDTATERSIQSVLDALQGQLTMVVIAHRLSTIRNVDEILVLRSGSIIEHGSWDELEAQGGLFCELLQDQKRTDA